MSLKLYSLGTYGNVSAVAQYASEKLSSLGYEASFSGSVLKLTVGGKQYDLSVYAQTSGSYSYYLWVNDENGDILISPANGNASSQGCNMGYMVSAGIMHCTNVRDGETITYQLSNPSWSSSSISNTNVPDPGEGFMTLQRAVIGWYLSPYYWGSKAHTPGIVIEVGSDKFVCLAAFLYAKL